MVNTDNHNIALLFEKTSQLFPQRLALVHQNVSKTYKDLGKEVNQTISYFKSKGLEKGDRVLVFVPMSPDLYRVVLALFKMGVVPVFLDEWVSVSRLESCCKLVPCKAIISSGKVSFFSVFISSLRKIPIKYNLNAHKRYAENKEITIVPDNETALITFTTGSTGKPKAANRTHGFLYQQFTALKPYLANENNPIMTMLPVVLLLNLAMGKTSVIADFSVRKPQKFNPEKLIQTLVRFEVESIIASPYFLLRIADILQGHAVQTKVSQLVSGGAPIFPHIAAKISNAFPKANFLVLYGSTEAEPISHCDAKEILAHKDSWGLYAGNIHPFVSIKIIPREATSLHQISDKELEEISLLENKPGEIIVSGTHVLTAYIDNPEAEKQFKIKTESGVWHRTGDLGYLNSKRELFLLGRHCFSNPEMDVYPFVIEQKLIQTENVLEGTIIQHNGQFLLFVALKDSSKTLPEWKEILGFSPAQVYVVKSLPRDPRHHSKIEYDNLSKMI